MTPDEIRKFWENVERQAAEVATWPAWKKAGIAIAVPEASRPAAPAHPNPHAVRRWINRLAQVFMLCDGESDLDFARASHLCVCPSCGAEYGRHAADPLQRWLMVLCDGRRVKL